MVFSKSSHSVMPKALQTKTIETVNHCRPEVASCQLNSGTDHDLHLTQNHKTDTFLRSSRRLLITLILAWLLAIVYLATGLTHNIYHFHSYIFIFRGDFTTISGTFMITFNCEDE